MRNKKYEAIEALLSGTEHETIKGVGGKLNCWLRLYVV